MFGSDPQRPANDRNNEGSSECSSTLKNDINPNPDGTCSDMEPVIIDSRQGEMEITEPEGDPGK